VTLSRTSRRPAFGSIFLLNNISYLRLHLLLQPSDHNLPILIPQTAEEVLKSNFRTAKAGYFDSNFSPLMQAISEDPRDKSNRSAAKEKFTRFFDLLDEVIERHKIVTVLEDDAEGRDAMRDEVVMVVVPSFQKFTQKQKDKEFSKSMFASSPYLSFGSKNPILFFRSSEM
jgi:exocyst complex component 7